jgi:hypothetical protein
MKANTSAEPHIALGSRTEKRPYTRTDPRAASIILILSFDLSARDDYTLLYPPLSSPEHTAPGTFWILIALHYWSLRRI